MGHHPISAEKLKSRLEYNGAPLPRIRYRSRSMRTGVPIVFKGGYQDKPFFTATHPDSKPWFAWVSNTVYSWHHSQKAAVVWVLETLKEDS